MRRCLPLLPLLIAPVLLLRDAREQGRFLGQPFGEGWGHLFSIGQAARWLGGDASPGTADLLAFPDGMPFWPVDPLVTGLGAGLAHAAGGGAAAIAAGLTIAVLLLLVLAGVGGWALARAAGAGPWAACAAGIALQLHPYLLRSGQDGVVEVLAIGLLALVGAAALRAVRLPSAGAWAALAAAGAATAAASPYYAVYAALAWGLLVPWMLWRRQGAAWTRVGLVLALVFGPVAAPLLVSEHGPGGRLDPRFQAGGFQLAPQQPVLIAADGGLGPAPRRLLEPAPPRMEARKPTESWRDLRPLQSFPGGLTCALALGVALTSRRGRPWALLALVLFTLGVGPQLVMRTIAPRAPLHLNPLQELLQLLPLTRQLGNAQRLVTLYLLPALAGGAVALGTRARWAALLGGAALAEALLVMPGLRFATTEVAVDNEVLASANGPTVTFPVGDPPLWCGRAPPKRALFLAAVHGQPVAGDYGRGRRPADQDLVVTMASWARVPVDERPATESLAGGLEAPDPLGFTRLLLLFETLDPAQQAALQARARARWGEPLAGSAWGEVYALGGAIAPSAACPSPASCAALDARSP